MTKERKSEFLQPLAMRLATFSANCESLMSLLNVSAFTLPYRATHSISDSRKNKKYFISPKVWSALLLYNFEHVFSGQILGHRLSCQGWACEGSKSKKFESFFCIRDVFPLCPLKIGVYMINISASASGFTAFVAGNKTGWKTDLRKESEQISFIDALESYSKPVNKFTIHNLAVIRGFPVLGQA